MGSSQARRSSPRDSARTRNNPELFTSVEQIGRRHATPDELAIVHDARYIESVKRISERAEGVSILTQLRVKARGTGDCGAGRALDAVDRQCLTDRAHFAPHGRRDITRSCESNGILPVWKCSLGARYARTRSGAERVLIVDWDVHHGNGTQAIVESDAERFVSMHQWPWYPGTGAAEDRGPHDTVWNIPMRPGLPAETYVDAFERGVDSAAKEFIPDLVLISAGFDSLRGDPLGGFTLEPDHIVGLTERMVARAKDWCSGRVVSVLEGGYAPERTAEAAMAHLAALG